MMSEMQLTDICRTCNATESHNYHHLKDSIENYPEKLLADLLQEFIKIDLPDVFAEKLPQYMCDGCTRRLLDAHDFVVQARDATELLIKQLIKDEPVDTMVSEFLLESPIEQSSEARFGEQIFTEADAENPLGDTDSLDDAPLQDFVNTKKAEKVNRKAKRPIDNKSAVLRKNSDKTDYSVNNLCDLCGKTFKNLCLMKKHRRTHTGEKPFKCDLCEKSFSNNTSRKIHRRTHTGEKPVKCEFCQKSFKDRSNMKKHQRTHTGEKPYKCDLCEKAFGQLNQMQKHRRTHTGEKPYKCELCEKAFNSSSHLQRHRRTHTGEKPYPCTICGKASTTSYNLKQHMKTHK